MTWNVPPALGLYLKHPNDVCDLVTLKNEKDERQIVEQIPKEDWTKFREVSVRLGEAIAEICVQARQGAIDALGSTHRKKTQSNPKNAPNDWFAWAEMERLKDPTARIYVGAAVFHHGTSVFLIPYVAPIGVLDQTAKGLLRRVRVGLPDAEICEWFDDDSVTLAKHPITVESNLDVVLASCAATFGVLARTKSLLP